MIQVKARPPLTPELQEVVEQALPAAMNVAAKYARVYGSHLDWHGEASLRLCERVGDYDPGKSNPRTWAACHAHYACQELIRREVPAKARNRHKRAFVVLSLDRPATPDGKSFAAIIPDRRREYTEGAGVADGMRLIKGLTPIEKAVAWAVFVERRPQAEVADTLGVSKSRVQQVKVGAVRRLRETHGPRAAAEGGAR